MTGQGRTGKAPECWNSAHLLVVLVAAILVLADRASADTDRPSDNPVEFNIPAQFVPAALSELARQARVQLFFISDGFEDIQANAVIGMYSTQEALNLLLEGTGLTANYSAGWGIKVRAASAPQTASTLGSQLVAASPENASDHAESRQSETGNSGRTVPGLEEIVVTGTSIRGVIPESTPLQIFDAIDIRNSGAMTVEQFIRTLPQNNNTLTQIGIGTSSREPNSMANSAVDLRGLGVGTTLVLLNGRRMAPSSSGRAVDLSFIPLEAVERVEVLTDGASAIYGADAIGGVVNFVLKDQQDGAETVLAYGGAKGGSEVLRIDQSFGFNWSEGNALLAVSFMDQNELFAADRDFAEGAPALTLVPADSRSSVLLTASQLLPANVTLSGDLLYSTREPRTVRTQSLAQRRLEDSVDHEQTVVNLEVARSTSKKLNAALLLTYADATSNQQTNRTEFSAGTSGQTFRDEETATFDATLKFYGTLATMRSGDVRYAIGAGHSQDEYSRLLDTTAFGGRTVVTALDRSTRYAFSELLIPAVSASQNINGVRRLELTLAARYTHYSDFGDNASPKVGILWSPSEPLIIRGTFGESFKAPFLTQLDPNLGSFVLFRPVTLGLPDIWTQDDSAVVLMAHGPGNPMIGSEKARTYTLGFDLDLSGFAVSATYFDINYTDRIATPDPSGGFAAVENPQEFPELFELDPTFDQISQVVMSSIATNLTEIDASNPAAVHAATTAFMDNRVKNLSVTEMDGLDFSASYTTELWASELSLGIYASKIFGFVERITPRAAPLSHVDTVLFPTDLKGRTYLGLQKDRWNARLNVNYVDEYSNPFDAENPSVDDWVTLDLLLSYETATDISGLLKGLRIGLGVQNVLDEDPPFVTIGTTAGTSILEPVGFDPANANPIGRFVRLQISKRW